MRTRLLECSRLYLAWLCKAILGKTHSNLTFSQSLTHHSLSTTTSASTLTATPTTQTATSSFNVTLIGSESQLINSLCSHRTFLPPVQQQGSQSPESLPRCSLSAFSSRRQLVSPPSVMVYRQGTARPTTMVRRQEILRIAIVSEPSTPSRMMNLILARLHSFPLMTSPRT